MANKVPT